MKKAVFLDRDGVINKLIWSEKEAIWESPYKLEEFQLLPGVARSIKKIQSLGYLAIVVSNQPGVAKRKCDKFFLESINDQMNRLLHAEGVTLDGAYYCLHHPDSQVRDLKIECDCRKPKPGLLLQSASDHDIDLKASYLVGDREKDIAAGREAGCVTIQVATPEPAEPSSADVVAADLAEAAEKISDSTLRPVV